MADIYSYTQVEIDEKLAGKANATHTHTPQQVGLDQQWHSWTPTFVNWGGTEAATEVARGNTQIVRAKWSRETPTRVTYTVALVWGSSSPTSTRRFGIALPPDHSLVSVYQAGPGVVYREGLPLRSSFVGAITFESSAVFGWVADAGNWWTGDTLNPGDVLIATATVETFSG